MLKNNNDMTIKEFINRKMKNLTKSQKELFKTLVRLGDSKELALKTVLEHNPKNNDIFCYNAYCI